MGHARPQAPRGQKHQPGAEGEFEFWCNENVASELEKCERQVSSLDDSFWPVLRWLAGWLFHPGRFVVNKQC